MQPQSFAGLTIAFEPDASKQDVDAIHAGLSAYNQRVLGSERHEPMRLLVRDGKGQVVGGLLGELYYSWLYIAILWVHEDLRGRGIGRQLMAVAEEYASNRGRTHAHVDTLDFQAPQFYQRLGYTVWGELGPYGEGHVRYFLKKALPNPAQTGASL
jgi:GNAT superfamily N-acetyltransferase